ncbi:regulator component [Streptomyces sp. NPDC002446]
MHDTQLRKACEQRLRQLDLPQRFDAEQLCEAVAQLRDRPIKLEPLPAHRGGNVPCGIWVATDDADWLFYEAGTSAHHQMHIVAHEISHILWDHPGTLSLSDNAHLVGDAVQPGDIRRMSGRTSYTTEHEREAEMLASFIVQRAHQGLHKPLGHPTRPVDRWETLLAGPATW